jgi:competence ComEA-like helix-hairpin-helix protein
MAGRLQFISSDSSLEQQKRQKEIHAFGFVLAASLALCMGAAFTAAYLAHAGKPPEIVLNEKVNPNTAPPGSLMRLPGIGMGKAQAIVHYRNNSADPNTPVFRTPDDLHKVRGIGQKTTQGTGKYLNFD